MRLAPALAVLLALCAAHASTQQITHPEALAGRWESPDGQGGSVGMNILIGTTVPNSPGVSFADLPQTVATFQIGLYQRKDSDIATLGFKFFSTSQGGAATWDGQHLRIDLVREADRQTIHINLTWNESSSTWTGTYQMNDFHDAAIALKRPTHTPTSLLVGTWFEMGPFNNCLHIAQAQDGTFTAWNDMLQLPQQLHYANGYRPPATLLQNYGQIDKVKTPSPERVEVELGAYTAMCCSHTFAAMLSPDGKTLTGNWPPGINQSPRPTSWRRVEGESCTMVAAHRE